MLEFFLKGIAIGFLLALPVGPTMVLCVRYSLSFGVVIGLATGAGAGLADAVYGILAGYGIYAIVDFMETYRFFFHLFGSILLCYLGLKTLKENFNIKSQVFLKVKPSMAYIFLTTFTLTASSPLTFVGVSALCATFGIASQTRSLASPWILGAGLFLGSCIWWLILSSTLSFFRKKVTGASSRWIGKISGSILFLLGIALFIYSLIER